MLKKTIEDFKVQENLPNNYLRNEIQTKTSIIKSREKKHRFLAPAFSSDTNQCKFHKHDRKHQLVSENRTYDSSKNFIKKRLQ